MWFLLQASCLVLSSTIATTEQPQVLLIGNRFIPPIQRLSVSKRMKTIVRTAVCSIWKPITLIIQRQVQIYRAHRLLITVLRPPDDQCNLNRYLNLIRNRLSDWAVIHSQPRPFLIRQQFHYHRQFHFRLLFRKMMILNHLLRQFSSNQLKVNLIRWVSHGLNCKRCSLHQLMWLE